MDQNAPLNLATLYARYIDDRTFDRLPEIMAEDIQVSAPNFQCSSLPEFVEVLQQLHNFSVTMHLIGNQFGDWHEGIYEGETYCIANHIYEKDGIGRKWEVGIRYQDRIISRDGQPLFSHRHLNVLWELDHPLQIPGDSQSEG